MNFIGGLVVDGVVVFINELVQSFSTEFNEVFGHDVDARLTLSADGDGARALPDAKAM